MNADLEAFRNRFKGTRFADWEIVERPIPGGEVAFHMAIPIAHDTTEIRANEALWLELRALSGEVGRYPLLYWDEGGGDPYDREEFGGDLPMEVSELAAHVEVEIGGKTLHQIGSEYDNQSVVAESIDFALSDLRGAVDRLPTRAQLEALAPKSHVDVERFLLHWERDHSPTGVRPTQFGTMEWTAYEGYTDIVWLPVEDPAAPAAFISFYGAGNSALFLAYLKSWGERFGAQVAANANLTIDLWLERPPADLDVAFELACELSLFNRYNDTYRSIARTLMGRNRVQLYNRP